ncbi:MAG TPA: hypothetical protein VM285_02230 [Polyangia bacterium]|nr:hypothetical protein [Polyangia bacterium]
MTRFVKNGTHLVAVDRIEWADYSRIEELVLVVGFEDQTIRITGIDALESAMAMRPSCLEGKRLRWAKHKWLVHNLIGHPLMQLLALVGKYDLAFRVHEATVPMPRGAK